MEKEIQELRGVIASTFETYKEANDKALAEAAKSREATAETRAMVDKINKDSTEMSATLRDLEARSQRPRLKCERQADP